MAALTITADAVIPSQAATIKHGTAGGTITRGMPIYKSADGYKACQADAAATAVAEGIALNDADDGQPVTFVTEDPALAIGATVVAGGIYVVGADAAGDIAPFSDLTTGDRTCILGPAASTTTLNFKAGAHSVGAVQP